MLTKEEIMRLDRAIDKVLSDNDEIVIEGRNELNDLNKNGVFDDALFFWRADAYAQQYYKGKASGEENKSLLQKAVFDYKRLISKGCYEHLRPKLEEWENELK